MRRLFEEHILRDVKTLDGFWDFAKDEDGIGTERKWNRSFPETFERMPVPSCWDSKPQYFDYAGTAWYRRRIHLNAKSNILLEFEAVSGISEVFFDGVRLGTHNGSYTPFSFLRKSVSAGYHELIVKVDNKQYGGKVMPDYSDWHLYGGIFRPVCMSSIKDVWIRQLKIDYRIENGKVLLSPAVMVRNLTNDVIDGELAFELDGKHVSAFSLRLEPGEEKTVVHDLGRFTLSLWSPASPNLHTLRASYCGDDMTERTGFRKIEMKNRKVFINGKAVKLLGVNRHHEYGDNGFSVPPEITLRDFEIIRDMGCNAVRCHYPMDSYAIDICDELGILLWAEIPFWGRWPHVVAQKRYLKLGEQCLDEMITRDFNHPSIFVWSVLNECATDIPDGMVTVKRLTEKVRSLDSSRAVSYASNKILSDMGYGHLDLIGINGYPGWYDATAHKLPKWQETIAKLNEKMKKEGIQDIPVLITETGAGALYGDRSLEDRKWSEGTQMRILEDSLKYILSTDDVAGVFIWQFCDIRTQTREWERRPGCNNNKGLLDRFRRPKMAYYKVKELFTSYMQTLNGK